MEFDNTIAKQPFIPIILGGNLGVYSIARSFHEAYEIKSISVSRGLTGPIMNSSILYTVVQENMDGKESLLACLNQLLNMYPGTPKFLLGSDDWQIEMIIDISDQLGDEWITPYTKKEVHRQVTNKSRFYELCEELGVDYPKNISFSEMSADKLTLPFDFPVVIKPANSITYQRVSFPGKNKVFIVKTQQELERIITLIRAASYTDELIIQEFVPGDDTAMHILTLYTAQDSETKLASFGQTLIEDHSPSAIGNPLAIRTFSNELVVQQAMKLVDHVGYVGYSNFDIKYDKRDGKYKFFELNARLGRSNYYVTAEGHNTAEYYVKDYLYNEPMEFSLAQNEVLFSVIPKRLLLKHIKQKDLRNKTKALYRSKSVKHPLKYSVEKSFKRLFYVFASTFNYYLKLKKHPPNVE